MERWHHPVRGSDFPLRTELEVRIRDNHGADGVAESAGGVEELRGGAVLDRRRLRKLQAATDNPSVSLLMPTTPARAVTPPDRGQMAEMARQARRRLAQQDERPPAA